ncbi:MAG: transglutaminase domain-containing protein [Planctomycetota bacterium]
MFTLYAPVAVRTDERRTLSFDPSTLLLRDVSIERVGRYWNYALKIDPQPTAAALESITAGNDEPARNVGFPVAEVVPIAREILDTVRRNSNIPERDPTDPASAWTYNRETARAIASWMRANFSYTTDLSSITRVAGEDPIVSFLTTYREGHCEFFASGLCAVLRSLGIESRVVTGYIAIEYDDGAGAYIVRESNAHAWVEVRTGPAAWIAVDATPEETLITMQEQSRSFADRFRWIYDRIEFLWNSRIVTYDSSTQATLADRVQGTWIEGLRERLQTVAASMRAIALNLSLGRAGGVWFVVIAVSAATAALAVLITLVRRRRLLRALRADRTDRREQRRLMRAAPFYAEALDLLARAGIERPQHLSPRAFAAWLAERDADIGTAFADIAEGYYQVRFGGLEPTQAQASAYSARVSAIRTRLRQKPALGKAD